MTRQQWQLVLLFLSSFPEILVPVRTNAQEVAIIADRKSADGTTTIYGRGLLVRRSGECRLWTPAHVFSSLTTFVLSTSTSRSPDYSVSREKAVDQWASIGLIDESWPKDWCNAYLDSLGSSSHRISTDQIQANGVFRIIVPTTIPCKIDCDNEIEGRIVEDDGIDGRSENGVNREVVHLKIANDFATLIHRNVSGSVVLDGSNRIVGIVDRVDTSHRYVVVGTMRSIYGMLDSTFAVVSRPRSIMAGASFGNSRGGAWEVATSVGMRFDRLGLELIPELVKAQRGRGVDFSLNFEPTSLQLTKNAQTYSVGILAGFSSMWLRVPLSSSSSRGASVAYHQDVPHGGFALSVFNTERRFDARAKVARLTIFVEASMGLKPDFEDSLNAVTTIPLLGVRIGVRSSLSMPPFLRRES